MKVIYLLLVFIVLCACSSEEPTAQQPIVQEQPEEEGVLFDEVITFEKDSTSTTTMTKAVVDPKACTRVASFGDLEICLPKLDHILLYESYTEPTIKKYADESEVQGNEVIGYYVTAATLNAIGNNTSTTFDSYCKLYGTSNMKNFKVGEREMTEFSNMMETSFEKMSINQLSPDPEKLKTFLKKEEPILLKNYSTDPGVYSYVMLVRSDIGGNDVVLVMCINMIKLKERLVNMAYYAPYKDESSVHGSNKTNAVIIKAILSANS